MDVDLTQIGQNIAFAQEQMTKVERETLERETSISSTENIQGKSQENTINADILNQQVANGDNDERLAFAVEQISEFVQQSSRDLSFSVADGRNQPIVVVSDSSSGEVIRQIPSEEVLALAERIKELQSDVGSAVGVLFNKEV